MAGPADVTEKDCWVFGYGSLIWRVDFPYLESRPCRVSGYVRRFWQGSTDHRGIPGKPGRVVTLVSRPGQVCWGRAFLLPEDRRKEILADLDHREKGGYRRRTLTLHFEASGTARAVTWIAEPDNPNYLGPASAEAIARQVLRSTGPSGSNAEYVLQLDDALREAGERDVHVSRIAHRVRTESA